MKQLLLLFFVVLMADGATAQQRAVYSNYLLNDYYYNPAIAGSKDVHIASLSYRKQWVGFTGAPSVIMGNFYGSVKNRGKVGYGLSVVSEKTGITNNTTIYINYAHHFKLGENIKLGLGVKPGYMQYRVKLYEAILADDGDDVLTGNVYSANAFDLSAGFNLYSPKFFVMGSMHHILGKEIQFTAYNSNLTFHFNAIAGYNIKFKKKNWELQPSVMVKYADPFPLQVSGMLKANIQNKYWFGVMYRTDDAVGVSLGLTLKERFMIGYGYDYTLSRLNNYQTGSHEVMLSFVISKKKDPYKEDDELNKSILEEMQKQKDDKDLEEKEEK